MTLVLLALTEREAVVTADCLLSDRARPYDDEAIKTASVRFRDARLAMGYSGLAGLALPRGHRGPTPAGAFRTMEWLLNGILATGGQDGMIPSLHRWRDLMTATFPAQGAPPNARRLEVALAGFWATEVGVRPVVVKLTNIDTNGATVPVFDLRVVTLDDGGYVAAIGRTASITRSQLHELRLLADEPERPARALTGKSIATIRAAARSSAGLGVVGDICTSVVMYPNGAQSGTFVRTESSDVFLQSHLVDTTDGPFHGIWMDVLVRGDSEDGTPGGRLISFPRAAKASRCPCGSGLKYRHCHKRRKASRRRRANRVKYEAGPFRFPG